MRTKEEVDEVRNRISQLESRIALCPQRNELLTRIEAMLATLSAACHWFRGDPVTPEIDPHHFLNELERLITEAYR